MDLEEYEKDCSQCKWFGHKGKMEGPWIVGHCHFYPPVVVGTSDYYVTTLPETKSNGFCSKWEWDE